MSSLIVEVCRIDAVNPHPNAERLELTAIKGWQCVIAKGLHKAGDLVTYIPIDTVIPLELSDRLGVTKYLSNGRVRCARLRGEPSFGVVAPPFGEEGQNVAEALGCTKYIAPVKLLAGDAEQQHPLFEPYTSIENMRNFPAVFNEGEEVIGTEKIHGTNSRVGIIEGVRLAGSKGLQRKENPDSIYWFPWKLPAVAAFCAGFPDAKAVVLYGEIYGRVQSLKYGVPKAIAYRAFDAKVDGRYIDPDDFASRCAAVGLDTCPILYRGPFSLAVIRAASEGRSTVPGADNIREGIVVRPVKERRHERTAPGESDFRVILKYVSDDYLLGDSDNGADEQ